MLTVAEVKKTLKLIEACETKSKRFVNMVRKHGFEKAYALFVELCWENNSHSFNDKVYERLDIIFPLDDLFYEVDGDGDYTVGMDKCKTAKAFLRRYNAKRIAKLAKRALAKQEKESSQ